MNEEIEMYVYLLGEIEEIKKRLDDLTQLLDSKVKGANKNSAISMSELISLPRNQQTIVTLLMKKREASSEELAAEMGKDLVLIEQLLSILLSKGFIEKQIQKEVPIYRVAEIRKKAKKLPPDIWKSLETRLEE